MHISCNGLVIYQAIDLSYDLCAQIEFQSSKGVHAVVVVVAAAAVSVVAAVILLRVFNVTKAFSDLRQISLIWH